MTLPRLVGLLLATFALPAAPLRARAEEMEETEHRLKSVGIEEPLRERIREAIRRGVAWVRGRQAANGSVFGHAGHTALCGLALRHAGIPEGVEGGRRAIAWLRRSGRQAAAEETYTAGLTAMLLLADRSEASFAGLLHERLARGARGGPGYWGYGAAGGRGPPNLSTSQFACLGLWAAERLGAPPEPRAWRTHLDALLSSQQDDGSWGYVLPSEPVGGRGSYPTGTCMGLANLLLAAQALDADLAAADPERLARLRIAVGKGQAALRRHARWGLVAPHGMSFMGPFGFYGLYALEKACVFLGTEDLGGLPWYREGALWLLARQGRDGGWSGAAGPDVLFGGAGATPSQDVETAFALLFLLRVSESYRPVTPRPVDPRPVTTPGEAPAAPSAGAPSEDPGLEERLLDDLQRRLSAPDVADLGGLLRTLRATRAFLAAGQAAGAPRTEDRLALERRAEALLLPAVTRFTTVPVGARLPWQAVSFECLDVLAAADVHVGPRLMEAVLAMPQDASFPRALRHGWYGAAFECLRRVGPPGLGAFLLDRCVTESSDQLERTSAALVALAGVPHPDGGRRHAILREVAERLRPWFGRSVGHRPVADLFRDVTCLGAAFAAAGGASDFPGLSGTSPKEDLDRVLAWWQRHRGAEDPVWR